jgi:hypothetical protein
MYHVELRHFPHSAWRFNLSDQDLRAVVEPWIREKAVDFGERKWSPHLAKLTVLEGPKLEVQQLSMGRGWRTAQKQSQDVTERVLDTAREALQHAAGEGGAVAGGVPARGISPASERPGGEPVENGTPAPTAPVGGADALAGGRPVSDPVALGVQLAALLGPDPMGLLEAWRQAVATSPGLAPSDSLALAERALRRASADQG